LDNNGVKSEEYREKYPSGQSEGGVDGEGQSAPAGQTNGDEELAGQ
jgi:hypothetical protein